MSMYKHSQDDDMTRRLPRSLRRESVTVSAFGGGASLEEADRMANLSPRRAPALATRRPRGVLMPAVEGGTPHGMAVFDNRLFFAQGTTLYFMNSDAVLVAGAVSDTDKRFFVFRDCLYLFPDKLFIRAGSSTLRPMELDSGVLDKATFEGSTITLPGSLGWEALGFAVGDCLRVVNADSDIPAPEGYYRITKLYGRIATVMGSFPTVYQSKAKFLRVIPDLERICVSGDRVYGFAGKDIYVSAAGSALDFYSKGAADGSDPAVLHMGTDGDITACVAWQGYVVFFKADRICKLLGTRSDSFALQDRPAVGITARLADTLCEVGGDLYYLAENGVYRYRGQEPECISAVGDAGVRGGVGGTDGRAYCLAVKRVGDQWRQYCYLPEGGVWYAEDGFHPASMVLRNGFLCLQGADGYLWLASSDGRNTYCAYDECRLTGAVEASAVLAPDYRFQPDGCRLIRVAIRATSSAGTADAGVPSLKVLAEYADGSAARDINGNREVSLGIFTGTMTDRLLKIPVSPRLCDSVRLRLAMKGDWIIHAVTCEYERAGQ